MGLDTVRLKSPYMARSAVDLIKARGESFQKLRNETGEVMWEMTRTDLQGSFDSRIMVRPMYEDATCSKSGKLEWHPSEPYLLVEGSLPKIFYGQNIYGVLEDFQGACAHLHALLQQLLGVRLPAIGSWFVQRIDWAENFQLPYQAIQEFFEGIHLAGFPRRRIQKYARESIFAPGTTTTVKLYHKGPEFERHDRKRLFMVMRDAYRQARPKDADNTWEHRKASRKVAALQRLANTRLRAEVEIHAEKLDYDFGKKPKVKDVHSSYLKEVFDKDMARLLREGQHAIQIVRTSKAVRERLDQRYSPELAGLLHGFWFALATHGEDDTKTRFTRATFYRRRRQLMDVGVSWLSTDVQLIERQGQLLPADFSPIRANPRRCESTVRERPAFNYERELLKLAA